MEKFLNKQNDPVVLLPPIESITGPFHFDTDKLPFPIINQDASDLTLKKSKTESKKMSIKYKFTPEEDIKLMNIIQFGLARNWNQVAMFMGTRNARQCRERWNNYLNPYLRNDPWSPMEDALLMQKYKEYGSKWRKISKFFHNRSDNALRNRMQLLERHVSKNTSNDVPQSPPSTDAKYYCY